MKKSHIVSKRRFSSSKREPSAVKAEQIVTDSNIKNDKVDKCQMKSENEEQAGLKNDASHHDVNIDNLDQEQTERHISGKSKDYDTDDTSQDNLSATARTENDVSEMPENEVRDLQNSDLVVKVDDTKHPHEQFYILENQYESDNKIEEDIEEEIENSVNASNMEFDAAYKDLGHENESDVKEDILSELVEALSSDNNLKTSAQGQDSDTEIKEEIQIDSVKTDIFDELLDEFINNEEKKLENIEGSLNPKGDLKCCDSLTNYFTLFAWFKVIVTYHDKLIISLLLFLLYQFIRYKLFITVDIDTTVNS